MQHLAIVQHDTMRVHPRITEKHVLVCETSASRSPCSNTFRGEAPATFTSNSTELSTAPHVYIRNSVELARYGYTLGFLGRCVLFYVLAVLCKWIAQRIGTQCKVFPRVLSHVPVPQRSRVRSEVRFALGPLASRSGGRQVENECVSSQGSLALCGLGGAALPASPSRLWQLLLWLKKGHAHPL